MKVDCNSWHYKIVWRNSRTRWDGQLRKHVPILPTTLCGYFWSLCVWMVWDYFLKQLTFACAFTVCAVFGLTLLAWLLDPWLWMLFWMINGQPPTSHLIAGMTGQYEYVASPPAILLRIAATFAQFCAAVIYVERRLKRRSEMLRFKAVALRTEPDPKPPGPVAEFFGLARQTVSAQYRRVCPLIDYVENDVEG